MNIKMEASAEPTPISLPVASTEITTKGINIEDHENNETDEDDQDNIDEPVRSYEIPPVTRWINPRPHGLPPYRAKYYYAADISKKSHWEKVQPPKPKQKKPVKKVRDQPTLIVSVRTSDVPVLVSGTTDVPVLESGMMDVSVLKSGPNDVPVLVSGTTDVLVPKSGPTDVPVRIADIKICTEVCVSATVDRMQGARDGAAVHRQSEVTATLLLDPLPENLQLTRLSPKEDWFASRYLVGPFRAMKALLTNTDGAVAPEVQMIGFVMGYEAVITGIIDEVKLGQDKKTLIINDAKTLPTNDLPGAAVQRNIKMQLFLYLPLLRDFLSGNMPLAKLAKIYEFDPKQDFSPCFQDGIKEFFKIPAANIGELYRALVESLKELPKDIVLTVEYKLRVLGDIDDATLICTELLKYDEGELEKKLNSFFRGYSKRRGQPEQTLMTEFFNRKRRTE